MMRAHTVSLMHRHTYTRVDENFHEFKARVAHNLQTLIKCTVLFGVDSM